MADFETMPGGLPMLMGASRPRPSLQRSSATAAFVSQLLAERGQLPRSRGNAVGAYADGAKIAVKRLPMGYRTSIVV
jgi:hypothetical protein